MKQSENIKKLKKLIESEVFVKAKDEKISDGKGSVKESGWLFDFRRVLMKADVANCVSEIFWDDFKNKYPFQIGSLEVAGIPLTMSLMHHIYNQAEKKDMNAFFIRKSRKKSGLLKMIEGVVEKNKEIILVDDLINSGSSFIRMVTVLEELGFKINTVWTILRFREIEYYKFFSNKNISIKSIFDLKRFWKNTRNKKFSKKCKTKKILWKYLKILISKSKLSLCSK